jgi:hypothetical protein
MLKPSPAFSHLAAATDAAVMQPIFRKQLSEIGNRPTKVENFFIPRVIPKGNGRFLIQYRFTASHEGGRRDWIFFGRLLSPSEMIPSYAKEPNAFFVADIRLVVPVFPFDPKLKVLPQFFQPEKSAALLQSLARPLCLNGTARIEKVEVLGYRLERRGVLNIAITEQNRNLLIVAKLVRPEKAAGLFEQLQALEANGFDTSGEGHVRVPHPLTVAPEGVLWLEALSDPSLHDLIGTEKFISGCRSAGAALQKLHRAALKDLLPYTIEQALTGLKGLAFETAQIYPVLQETIESVRRQLETGAPKLEEKEFAPVHRDFYDKQLLTGETQTTLLDTDTLALGDPALDAGNFLAHLILRGKQHSLPEKAVGQAKGNFLEAYNSHKSSAFEKNVEKRIAWWEAAALLRLACLYSLRPRWKKLARPLLEQSEKTLRGENYA